jgi:glycosyltransferase involved in cell wall biosynthesis
VAVNKLEPKISVLIPTYNQESCVLRAINSARSQTWKNLEIIISDDCSTDGSEKLIRDYLEEIADDRIVYYRHVNNIGILRNYHETLNRASGDYVVNLDGDDFFIESSFIERAVQIFFENSDVKLIFTDYYEYYQSTKIYIPIKNRDSLRIFTSAEFLESFSRGMIAWNHNAIIYSRVAAVELGFYWHKTVPRNDWESFLRLAAVSSIGHLALYAAAWVRHDGNETGRMSVEKSLRNFVLIDEIVTFGINFHGEKFFKIWRKRMYQKELLSSANGFLACRDWRGFLAFMAQTFIFMPMLTLHTLCDFRLWIRAALAYTPNVYVLAKSIFRHLKS